MIRTVTAASAFLAIALLGPAASLAHAETCTTQSALAPADRDGIATAARNLATRVQSNDAAGIKSLSVDELAKDFGGLQYLVAVTAPKLAGGGIIIEQVYVLDATNLKKNADGSSPDAEFFCSLNHSTMETQFAIRNLTPGKYAFAMATLGNKSAPWRVSVLMRQEQGKWLLAGLYPKPLTAAGHDGLWYWTQARQMAKDKQQWNAWLYYQSAQKLLQPADFVLSTHYEKLITEATAAAPPALSDGISPNAPLVIKGADGTEYRWTDLGVDDSQSPASLNVAAHLHVDPLPDQAAARKRNADAASALVAAYPELRKPFHGVSVYAEAPGQPALATELLMADIK